MSAALVTTAQDAIDFFTLSLGAKRALEGWRSRRPHVTERVMQHKSQAVYQVRSVDVRELVSEHALSSIRPDQGYKIKRIRDWYPDFAFTHIFHFLLEARGRAYSYEELRDMCLEPPWRPLLADPAQQKVLEAVREGYSEDDARTAMRWRVGLAYYSFMRELYTVAKLREHGLDMRVHPLADALFRADAWCANTVFSLYVRNKVFRDGAYGRKPAVEELLGPGRPELRFVALQMETQHDWGRVHLPSDEEILQCAEQIGDTGTVPEDGMPR
ncbi:hypothetical protein [Nocardiopsis rhodophaea]|uniref:hypothetical protein n=1 Tax=Nocardiopsis rhodophaea TaxID=280238 RepID=UPI0031DF4157